MAVSAIISIGVPIFLFLFFRKRFSMSAIPMLVGAVAFVVFALILERSIHILVLRPSPTGEIALKNQPLLYVLYGVFMAGIFEETARFLSFYLLKKKYNGIGTGISYGIGHGGVEAVILAGVAMISNLVFSMMINSGATALLPEAIQGEVLGKITTALTDTAPYMFLISGIERIFAIAIQVSLSIIVFYSVFCKGKWWLFPLAILIHAIVDCPAAIMQTGVIKNVFLVEGLAGVSALLLIYLAVFMFKKFNHNIINSQALNVLQENKE
ncbi:MAG: YhfC family intramembrane metalloprotease [Paludibacter sp.]|nr:YhfC family intramembrane metalloprotease [Paludibacter sp.]